jgi:hypothetical protein
VSVNQSTLFPLIICCECGTAVGLTNTSSNFNFGHRRKAQLS